MSSTALHSLNCSVQALPALGVRDSIGRQNTAEKLASEGAPIPMQPGEDS